jgi:hypothetical protein
LQFGIIPLFSVEAGITPIKKGDHRNDDRLFDYVVKLRGSSARAIQLALALTARSVGDIPQR